MEWRFAAGQFDSPSCSRGGTRVGEVDVIVSSPAAASVPAKNATSAIPVVFVYVSNPVAIGRIVLPDPLFASQKSNIARLALQHHLPSMFGDPEFVEAGGLMSYGDPLGSFMKRAAYYVDQIFKGVKPADLPVQQPTRFELAINLKTAAVLGLKVPATLVAAADRIIE